MRAPLGRGVWGDVSNSWNLSNLRRKGKHIWGDVGSETFLLTRKTSPPDLLFEEEEHTTMKAPLRRGVWGDVRNSKCLSNLRMNG